jgi:putative ABC transport system substrate-binding protein
VIERHWTLGKGTVLVKELAALRPAVILASGEPSARAAQQAAPSVPIVLGYSGDPVAGGFARSLARPGGNVTGVATLNEDTSPKLLELALTVVPGPRRVAVLANPTVPSYASVLKNLQNAARQAKVDLLLAEVRDAAQIEGGFARIAQEKLRAVVVLGDPLVFQERRPIADLALKHQVASVYPAKEHVEAGGLISYGVNIADGFRRAAGFVDKILKGAKPGDLPIQQATTLELVINLKTAKALGITIPQSLLLRADRVIE